jgi:hypothetical protein
MTVAVNPLCPAFIDPPDPHYGSLDEWLAFREDLLRSTGRSSAKPIA